jgi:hypothetical protein
MEFGRRRRQQKQQAVASILHGSDVDVSIIKRKGEDDSDHVQFSITEKKRKRIKLRKSESVDVDSKRSAIPRPETWQLGCPASAAGDGRHGDLDELGSDEEEEEESELFGRNDREVSDTISMLSLENRISPLTFCNAFPFHLIFDRDLSIRQVSKHIPIRFGHKIQSFPVSDMSAISLSVSPNVVSRERHVCMHVVCTAFLCVRSK